MRALFVLVPIDAQSPGSCPEVVAAADGQAPLHVRRYPRAEDARHLLGLVRAGRDKVATRWLRGMVGAVLLGAVLGAVTNGILSSSFDMFGGLGGLAVSLGAGLGAFLGAFTAVMTGTEVAREEVRALARHMQKGDVLEQWTCADAARLRRLQQHCAERQLHAAAVD